MTWKTIVGERFAPDAFERYVAHLTFGDWRPQFVVVHNTASPTLAERPEGFTHAHILNLQAYYRDELHWSAGPHCFVDQNGIWVFTPLTTPGVHSPSWNQVSWGVEALGDYRTEAFAPPVRDHLIACLATLHHVAGLDTSTMKLHREDPKTEHKGCPGDNVQKDPLIQATHDLIVTRRGDGHATPVPPA